MPALNVASALAAAAANTLSAGTSIVDTAANVSDNLDALRAIAGQLGGIRLTDGGRPALSITSSQQSADAALLALVAQPYALEQRLTAAQAAGAALPAGFRYFAIVDSAANIAAYLPAIETLWSRTTLGVVRLTDPGRPVFSVSAAQLAAGFNTLARIAAPYTIVLNDFRTPTLFLPKWDTATAIFTTVIASITTPFHLAFDGPIRPATIASILGGADRYTSSNVSLAANPIAPYGTADPALLPGRLDVLDDPARLSNFLAALQIVAAAGKINSITQRDGGVQRLSLTPQQARDNALALALFSPNTQLSQVITAAQAASLPPLEAGFASYTVQDSTANILANLAALAALARSGRLGRLRFVEAAPDIVLTVAALGQAALALSYADEARLVLTLADPGTPTVKLAADLLSNADVRARVLNQVAGSYRLVVAGAIGAATAAAILSENNKVLAALSGVVVADFSANIGLISNGAATRLDALQALAAAGRLARIDLLDGGVPSLALSAATRAADAAALALIGAPHSVNATLAAPLTLSAAAFLAQLPALEAQAEANALATIVLSDAAPPVLTTTAAILAANLAAFDKIVSAYRLVLTDPGTPALTLQPWQVTYFSLVVLSAHLSGAFRFSVGGAVSASAAATLASLNFGARLTGAVAVADFSANVIASRFGLEQLFQQGHLGPIALLDSAPARLALSPADVAAVPDVLAAITTPYRLSRTVAASAAAIPIADPFGSLTVVDTAANVTASLAALEPLAAAGRLFVSLTGPAPFSLSAAALAAAAEVFLSSNTAYSIALTDGGTANLTLKNWQVGNNIATLLNRIRTPFSLVIDGPVTPRAAALLADGGSAVIAAMAAGSLFIRDSFGNLNNGSSIAFKLYLPQLLALANAGKIASIDVRDSGVPYFALSPADATNYAPVLMLLNVPYVLSQIVTTADLPTPVPDLRFNSFTVKDSVANVLSHLSQLQPLAASGRLGQLWFTDAAPRLVTSAASLMSAADVWGTQNFNPLPVVLTDPGTPLITLPSHQLTYNLRNHILDPIVGPWQLQISGRASAATLAAIAEEHNGVLAHLSAPVTVADYSYNITRYFEQLKYLGSLGDLAGIQLLDTGPLRFSVTLASAIQDIGTYSSLTGAYGINVSASTGRWAAPALQAGGITTSGITTATFADGRMVFDPGDIVAQIYRMYLSTLGRGPDPGGLHAWAQALRGGATLQSVADAFITSAEFVARYGAAVSNADFVTLLYQNVLHRVPDPGGAAAWLAQLNGGLARSTAVLGFSESGEHIGLTRAVNRAGIWDLDETAAQVVRMYDTVFGRLADTGGLVGWRSAMAGGTTLSQLADAFVASAEFQATYRGLSDTAFVSTLYQHALGRPADPGGLAVWVDQLARGMTRAAVVLSFSESQEHRNNTAASLLDANLAVDGVRTAGPVLTSAAALGANLDRMAAQVASGEVTGLTLTDTGVPSIAITAAQIVAAKPVLQFLGGSFTLDMHATTFASAGAPVQAAGIGGWSRALYVQLADGRVVFDPAGADAQVYRLYDSAFGRASDPGGQHAWSQALTAGTSLDTVAGLFLGSAEFQARYGAAVTDHDFVTLLYQNVLHRVPDPGGRAVWEGALGGGSSRVSVLVQFSESAEHKVNLAPAIRNGVWDMG